MRWYVVLIKFDFPAPHHFSFASSRLSIFYHIFQNRKTRDSFLPRGKARNSQARKIGQNLARYFELIDFHHFPIFAFVLLYFFSPALPPLLFAGTPPHIHLNIMKYTAVIALVALFFSAAFALEACKVSFYLSLPFFLPYFFSFFLSLYTFLLSLFINPSSTTYFLLII